MATLFARSRPANVLTYHGELEWQLGWISYFSYLALPFLNRWAARTVAVSDRLYEKMVSRWKAHPSRLLTEARVGDGPPAAIRCLAVGDCAEEGAR